ncbi:MAG: zinc-binding dehydrogenase, partial [Actinobacteria bacterium]|nr:zinc-binding dehydrogenase [Actinomycetota bacterium]
LSYLADLVASGELTPAIDRHYELREVPAALTYLGEGHALGTIVIKIEERFLR